MQSLQKTALPASAIAAAVLIAAIWGFNFVVIKIGVEGIPPLMLAALRFVFSVFPALLFVKRPAVSWGALAGYGLFLGVGEFGLLFTALKLGAPAGLSSIVLQAQAFFTAAIAALAIKEKIRGHSIVGMLVAGAGIVIIGLAQGTGGTAGMTPLLLAMTLLAALGWAAANVIARGMPGGSALGLMVWSSLFSPLPLGLLSYLFEGPAAMLGALRSLSLLSVSALAYLVLCSTLLGYGLWNALIIRHGAARIAPFSLMVPVFGLSSASIFLGERFSASEALASVLVLAGLALHVFGGRVSRLRRPRA